MIKTRTRRPKISKGDMRRLHFSESLYLLREMDFLAWYESNPKLCKESIEETVQAVWQACPRADWLLWLLEGSCPHVGSPKHKRIAKIVAKSMERLLLLPRAGLFGAAEERRVGETTVATSCAASFLKSLQRYGEGRRSLGFSELEDYAIEGILARARRGGDLSDSQRAWSHALAFSEGLRRLPPRQDASAAVRYALQTERTEHGPLHFESEHRKLADFIRTVFPETPKYAPVLESMCRPR